MSEAKSTIDRETVEQVAKFGGEHYKYGFESHFETDEAPIGLSESIIHFISEKKNEPDWMLEWRLSAYRYWRTLAEPDWANLLYTPTKYDELKYYSAPVEKKQLNSLDEIDPELRRTFEKLGISLDEQKRLSNVAVDAVIDSVSVATTFKETLAEKGVIFCSISEAFIKQIGTKDAMPF